MSVVTDLQAEIAHLTTLLETSKTIIINQAQTISEHLSAIQNVNSLVVSTSNTLNEFETWLGAAANSAVVQLAAKVEPLVAEVIAQTVPSTTNTVANVIANSVISVLSGDVEKFIHGVQAEVANVGAEAIHFIPGVIQTVDGQVSSLDNAFINFVKTVPTSNLHPNVAMPAQVTTILNEAEQSGKGFLKTLEDIAEGKQQVKIGPLEFKI